MCIVYPIPLEGPAALTCAQAGCRVCLDVLMDQHERLVHYILRRQVCGDVTYDELLQEGRITLWQAIVHFDSGRGVAFSAYAGVAIQHRIWRGAKREVLPTGEPFWEAVADAQEEAEEQLRAVLQSTRRHWPPVPTQCQKAGSTARKSTALPPSLPGDGRKPRGRLALGTGTQPQKSS